MQRDMAVQRWCIYVGDSRRLSRRLIANHRGGNVEASALRKHLAESMGNELVRTKRPGGSVRVRVASLDGDDGEHRISQYLRSGSWKYVVCRSYAEASDFQWFAIERLDPLVNRRREAWREEERPRYEALLATLEGSPYTAGDDLDGVPGVPGVYVLYHQRTPGDARDAPLDVPRSAFTA